MNSGFTNLDPETAQRAINKRNGLIAGGAFSSPEGKIAVITSMVLCKCDMSPNEAVKLRLESLSILDALRLQGRPSVDVTSPTTSDMDAILQDPSITDLCVIGEGAIGNLYVLESSAGARRGADYDWISVSGAADHLKMGNIFQRMCSVVSISPVIWGTFAAADLRKIWISEEPRFIPEDLHSRSDQGLITAYEDNVVSYEGLWDLASSLRDRDQDATVVGI